MSPKSSSVCAEVGIGSVGFALTSNKLVGLSFSIGGLRRRNNPDAPPTAKPVTAPAAPASRTWRPRSGDTSPPAKTGARPPVTNCCPASVKPSAKVPRPASRAVNAPRCPAAFSLVVPSPIPGSLLPMYRVKSKNSGKDSRAAYGAAASKATYGLAAPASSVDK